MGDLLPAHWRPQSHRLFEQDPINQLQEDIDHLLSRYSLDWDEEWTMRPAVPACDLSETDEALHVRIDLPGINPDDIELGLTAGTLRITAQRETSHHRSDTLSRSIRLPCPVQADEIEAICRDGVLTITLPKVEQSQTQTITVKTGG